VNVDLSEFDVAQVEPGMKAIVSVDALGGEPYGGKVVLVAFTGTDNGGIVTFPVRVGLSDSEGLKPGMNTSVRIIVAQKKSVVRVPLEAVTQDEEDRSFVTVLDESGQEVERPVQIGLENSKQVEIVKGLSAGARVVLPEPDPAQEEE
jgi:HlyD family secretion protein